MVLKHPAQKRNISLHTSGVELVHVYIYINIKLKKKKNKKKERNTHIDAMKLVLHLLFIKRKC